MAGWALVTIISTESLRYVEHDRPICGGELLFRENLPLAGLMSVPDYQRGRFFMSAFLQWTIPMKLEMM